MSYNAQQRARAACIIGRPGMVRVTIDHVSFDLGQDQFTRLMRDCVPVLAELQRQATADPTAGQRQDTYGTSSST